MRRAIEQLEPGLEIVDDGAERSVSSGLIDITAQDGQGAIVVIELKSGTARQGAVAQVLSYMGDITDDEPDREVRGILVAGDFDKKARAAARVVPIMPIPGCVPREWCPAKLLHGIVEVSRKRSSTSWGHSPQCVGTECRGERYAATLTVPCLRPSE